MTRPRRVLFALLSLVFPGVAQGLAGRPARMAAALGGSLALALGLLVTPLLVIPLLAFRVAVAVDGYVVHRDVPAVHRGLGALALVLCLVGHGAASTTFSGYRIPAASMLPTLEIGDRVLVNRLVLRWRGPARGEIIVFRFPCEPANHYIKRVIGVPGDTVELRCDRVFLNGRAIAGADRFVETLGDHTYRTHADDDDRVGAFRDWPQDPRELPRCMDAENGVGAIEVSRAGDGSCPLQMHYVVPPDSYFVLGDYRDNSNDSRAWGVVPAANVHGVLIGVFWPLARAGRVE